MKILLVIHEKFDPNSGAAGSIIKLGNEYRRLGHEVDYYSMDDLPQKMHYLAKEVLFPEFLAFYIASKVKKEKFDVIDASTGDIWFWAKVLQKFSKFRPLLVTRSHGLEHLLHLKCVEDDRAGNARLSWKYPFYRGSILLSEVAASLKHSDLIFLLNCQEKKYAISNLHIEAGKIKVVANGIPDTFLNLPIKPSSKSKEDIIRIAQIGTYIPRKGIQYGTPALNTILARYPNVKVTFLGTECRECSSVGQVYADFDHNVRDRITVIPRYNHANLPELLKEHHIKLFPTLSEGFALSLIEAMACGLAPITTAHPAALETVKDGCDAVVVPLHNVEAIEQALNLLIEDRDYLETLRYGAYATAQNYSWNSIAKESLSTYKKSLELKKGYFRKSSK